MNWLFMVLAALGAVTAELLFRKGWVWQDHLPVFLPLSVGINYAAYRMVAGGPTLLIAIAGFNLTTLLVRSGISQFVLHESVARGNLVAAGAMALGVLVGVLWR